MIDLYTFAIKRRHTLMYTLGLDKNALERTQN